MSGNKNNIVSNVRTCPICRNSFVKNTGWSMSCGESFQCMICLFRFSAYEESIREALEKYQQTTHSKENSAK